MAQPVIAEPGVDLHNVALGLEAAGYTIANVLETRLTVGTLHTTTNPVIVLLNDQASQCILVEMVSEQSPLNCASLFPVTSEAWRALVPSLTGCAVQRYSDDMLPGDELLNESALPVGRLAMSLLGVLGIHTVSLSSILTTVVRHAARAKRILSCVYVTLPGAVAHYVTLALLGGISGYFLRSLWLLVAVPIIYASVVVARIMWCARAA